MNEYDGNEIPNLNENNENNDKNLYIHNEIKGNDKYPKYHKNNELCFILYSDQEKYIILKKNDETIDFEEKQNLKNNSINNFNVSQIVLKAFKKKYSKIFNDLKGLQIKKYYKKLSSGNYETIVFNDTNSITNINFIIYVDINSTQVWVPTYINIRIFPHYSININSSLKLDRLSSEDELKIILIKS